ncbi:zinc finger MYM-type protein 1-like [Helianthus annuus]|uniref:zinc finger MYM-type protein 1-like n=1 Tax=Helianthus annuus TaxID=4232 RepID=UPI000B8FEB28|nr:zinc finger MYM-type protein 1-like [Helianthus annuus]
MAPKQPSGWQKRQKRKRQDELVKSQKGAMQKFLTPIPPIVDVEKPQEHVEVEREHDEVEQEQDRVEVEDEEHVEKQQEQEHVEEQQQEEHVDYIFDPRRWEGLNADEIKLLVAKGPKRDTSIEFGPYDKFNRRFSSTIYTRTLSNLEKLGGVGFDDWHHATGRVREHEVSLDHLINMKKWFDLRKRLKSDNTIDKFQYEQFKKEADYWKQVLFRIIALIKFLAKHNLAFRGNKEKLYEKGNGNFLGLVEMLEEFDPVIKEHVRRITSDDIHVHYLGHKIQNEIILMLADEIKKELIKNIKEAKYYSIILDCTPDSSHKEQMTIIVRYVKFSSNSVIVEESFLGFLNANDTTGKGLFDVTYAELQNLGLEIDDMRGQGYDNGANMKGSHQGVQTRFLKENPRAFYTPCGSHSLNLTLCDMAYSCVKGKSFFGHIQRIYTIFANSINRWQILKDNVKNWSLKSLSQTRWESRFESVKAIKLQLDDVREALLEVGETDSDAAIAEEALALAENQLSGFDFLVSIVIWYEVLNRVNIVSKKLQDYRETGFLKAIEEATEIASDMEIDPIFKEKRKIKRKKRKDETSSSEEVAFTVEENFRVNFFLYIVDQAIASLEKRFEQFKWYEGLFGFLFPRTLRIIKDEDLKSSCHRLENALRFKEKSDIDGEALYTELNLFRDSLTNKFSSPVDVLEYMKEDGYSPEACIAYRILLTIPVTVASAERSFSKLKLLKSYLRSSMSQERLSGLAMIAIENEVLDDINCEELIHQFAIKNARGLHESLVSY